MSWVAAKETCKCVGVNFQEADPGPRERKKCVLVGNEISVPGDRRLRTRLLLRWMMMARFLNYVCLCMCVYVLDLIPEEVEPK